MVGLLRVDLQPPIWGVSSVVERRSPKPHTGVRFAHFLPICFGSSIRGESGGNIPSGCGFDSCPKHQSRRSISASGDSVRITPAAVKRCIGCGVLMPMRVSHYISMRLKSAKAVSGGLKIPLSCRQIQTACLDQLNLQNLK